MIPQDLLLVKILKLAVKLLRKVELPKRAGRPFVYQPVVIICCLLVMVAKHLSVRGLYDFLCGIDGNSIRLVIPFPEGKIPNRRTFDRRFKQSLSSLQIAMIAMTVFLVKKFHLGIAHLSRSPKIMSSLA